MRNRPCLTLDDAFRMAAASRAAATGLKLEATIVIVDAGGHLLYVERADRQGVNSIEMATLKARTAALRERPSSAFATRVQERAGFLMVPNTLGIQGGVPIFHAGECVGGIGVSGISEHDEAIAQAGADAL